MFETSEEHIESKIKLMNQNGSLKIIVLIRSASYLMESAFNDYNTGLLIQKARDLRLFGIWGFLDFGSLCRGNLKQTK